MKILITAFDPFGGETVNPALEAVRRMRAPAGVELARLTVPTVFHESIRIVYAAMEKENPDAVLCVGQAAGRAGISPERVAINVDDARIPDNDGNQPADTPVFADGPAAYFSTLPVKAIVNGLRQGGLPAALSNSAGTFVCNHLMYGVLHQIARERSRVRAGFIHVPLIPAQAAARENAASMSLPDIIRALEIAVEIIAKTE